MQPLSISVGCLMSKDLPGSYPGESMRVIYVESLGPGEDASDELATVLIDADASHAFFGNDSEAQRRYLERRGRGLYRKVATREPLQNKVIRDNKGFGIFTEGALRQTQTAGMQSRTLQRQWYLDPAMTLSWSLI